MANIPKHTPFFGDITRFDQFTNMDNWFKDFGMRQFFNEMETAPLIKVDLSENDDTYTIRAQKFPG